MHLGIRILFGFFLITGLAGIFVLRIFVAEVKPSVREVMEDMMVDTANILAELAADDLRAGRMAQGQFATQVAAYARRPIDARIWGLDKQSLDFRVYVTDAKGLVVFDSAHAALGQDYSQWRDVARTLRGEYGARATREVYADDRSSVLYVAAPVTDQGRVIGVLTVAKPVATVQAVIDRAERKILVSGFWLLGLSAAVGVAVTLWVVHSIRQLRRYANAMETGKKLPLPRIQGELGELAQAMQAMRQRVEGRDYIEGYVRALTHELKSPLAAIRGAGELLQDPLPEPDRQEFTADILAQTQRLQSLVDRLLELSKLEQRQELHQPQSLVLADFLISFMAQALTERAALAIDLIASKGQEVVRIEPALLSLALANLLDNAAAFAPPGGRTTLAAVGRSIVVQDMGPGVPDYALPKLGQKFFSTVRPDGHTKGSGLGLAIVAQTMALHGGTLHIENTHPGLRVTLQFL